MCWKPIVSKLYIKYKNTSAFLLWFPVWKYEKRILLCTFFLSHLIVSLWVKLNDVDGCFSASRFFLWTLKYSYSASFIAPSVSQEFMRKWEVYCLWLVNIMKNINFNKRICMVGSNETCYVNLFYVSVKKVTKVRNVYFIKWNKSQK